MRDHEEHRERLFQALGGTYARQYPYRGGSILMLGVFHGRGAREGRDPSSHAARRRRSSCGSHSFSWFQLATMRITTRDVSPRRSLRGRMGITVRALWARIVDSARVAKDAAGP